MSLSKTFLLIFLGFSLIPLFIIGGYSYKTFHTAIDYEKKQRLLAGHGELQGVFSLFENGAYRRIRAVEENKSLLHSARQKNWEQWDSFLRSSLAGSPSSQVSLLASEGQIIRAYFRSQSGVEPLFGANEKDSLMYALDSDWLTLLEENGELFFVEREPDLRLVSILPVKGDGGETLAYIEDIVELSENFFADLSVRTDLVLVLFDEEQTVLGASQNDFFLYEDNFKSRAQLFDLIPEDTEKIFRLPVRGVEHTFLIQPLNFGDVLFQAMIGSSNQASRVFAARIQSTYFFIVGLLALLSVILSYFLSKLLLRPLESLCFAVNSIQKKDGLLQLSVERNDEIGQLTQGFNDMSARVFHSKRQLQNKIEELESAYRDLQEAQAKLVHSAKMASLGQLVAGVAHELNNPISFIYGNMNELRSYIEKLQDLIETRDPDILEEKKRAMDYDYMMEDLPRLVGSCEEGARRTRDIVLGLKNFSRVDQVQSQPLQLADSIESTLQLLEGEMKNRITIRKEYKEVPAVECYPSQINQVFMNILSNAAHAIEGEGEITIRIEKAMDKLLGECVVAVFSDTGKGIAKDELEKIFDPFYSTKPVGQGTGLGLSISYNIVNSHGGEIRVRSSKGKGSEFRVLLPLERKQKKERVA